MPPPQESWTVFLCARAVIAVVAYLLGWYWLIWVTVGAILPEAAYRIQAKRYELALRQLEQALQHAEEFADRVVPGWRG